ncbi:GIY-YIG nuclease family protein [Frigoribacterium sp. 9N]|uniref:GIY-YIG nuclease family protein n=1 Tax=Frigoribacterium sp. 9N TaxID=2653144 RepID=UPI0012F12D6D|nr:hypothetical protein [Frigoribacterium sp. 9N]VXB67489.1 conserved hypothetical protein [Frigoribacterium sp. 9N]
MTIRADLVAEDSFRSAGSIDADVPPFPGVYAIRLRTEGTLPEPFDSLLQARSSRLIYIGKATSLEGRMLRNELRGRGHGTFFRSIGAVLGYRPLAGSLATKVNKYNYSFERPDRAAIGDWINANLDVSWREVPLADVRIAEAALITEHRPLLNLDGNPLALAELDELRVLCRKIASGPARAL